MLLVHKSWFQWAKYSCTYVCTNLLLLAGHLLEPATDVASLPTCTHTWPVSVHNSSTAWVNVNWLLLEDILLIRVSHLVHAHWEVISAKISYNCLATQNFIKQNNKYLFVHIYCCTNHASVLLLSAKRWTSTFERLTVEWGIFPSYCSRWVRSKQLRSLVSESSGNVIKKIHFSLNNC